MAGIRKKGDGYHCTFRFQGRRYYFALGKMTDAQAKAKSAEGDETLALIERGRLTVPQDIALENTEGAGYRRGSGWRNGDFARKETHEGQKVHASSTHHAAIGRNAPAMERI